MTEQAIIYEREGPVVTITLNRPSVHNALTAEMIRSLTEIGREYDRDETARALVLTGAGERAFCTGRDLRSSWSESGTSPGGRHEAHRPEGRIFSEVEKPVIAAVNGHALGGGAELVLGTDIRVASDQATFGFPEVTLGLVPYGGAQVRMPQQVPWAKAMEMLPTGRRYSAAEALSMGLVNYVLPQDAVLGAAHDLAEQVARNAPLAVRRIKKAVRRVYNQKFAEAFRAEWAIAAEALTTQDAREGITAFLEKRPPVFRGR